VAQDYLHSLGLDLNKGENAPLEPEIYDILNEKLALIGCPTVPLPDSGQTGEPFFGAELPLSPRTTPPFGGLPPVDARIQTYLNDLLGKDAPQLPAKTLVLDQFGLARGLSLPYGKDEYFNDQVSSYRLRQGVLHNPKSDRRTTKGVFHVAEGGLPVAADKKQVPLEVFKRLLAAALNPPQSSLEVPFTEDQPHKAHAWASIYMRPMVAPEVPTLAHAKSMETRFFTPASLVCTLDFVESVFGNAGDPFTHDAALDVEHWSGHTGCIIMAPHLVNLTKKELGLPHISQASERQKRDRMCYTDDAEKYNDGGAFKITSRDERGVIVTILADNYFGYCKKEVKTQLSYATNLSGMCEEEHAGGALTFAAYDLGEDFTLSDVIHDKSEESYHLHEALEILGNRVRPLPQGGAVDSHWDNIVYVPQRARFRLHSQSVEWPDGDSVRTIKLMPNTTYVLPSGYKVEMTKPSPTDRWRLIGIVAEPVLCHKPSTVSGGGKSEISKSIADACITGGVFVMDFENDMQQVKMLLDFDYSSSWKDPRTAPFKIKKILDPNVSLGTVIKIFSVSEDYTDGYNDFLRSIPPHVLEMVLVIKRFYKPDWEEDWLGRFSVDYINGLPGHELKYHNQRMASTYLRVGYEPGGLWRTLGIRKDFFPAVKIQMEDDITASVVFPDRMLNGLGPSHKQGRSLKFVGNCEYRLFQRPDDAIIRGYDKQTERDMSRNGNFISNFAPLTKPEVKEMVEDAIRFDYFTEPMRDFLTAHASDSKGPAYAVCSANPRIVDGKPSKNPRYLQLRPDLLNPRGKYLAEVGMRLARRLQPSQPVYTPVTIIVPGRRNNPPETGVKPLCVFNPIHYLELPELFMEFTTSMTGKSPSTTGAGSEGALTKSPFNALLPIYDLNAAFVSAVLTDAPTFMSSAAWVGPHFKVDHDISLLVPEVFSRMTPAEREVKFLTENEYLERCEDFEYKGKLVEASRLGWRITKKFERAFFGRVFNSPGMVFTSKMLRPELQDRDIFAEGVQTIVDTHKMAAELYFVDGGIELAVPPLKALLTVMAKGEYEGMKLHDPEFRALFNREKILSSDWYQARLEAQQKHDIELWTRHLKALSAAAHADPAMKGLLNSSLAYAQRKLTQAQSPEYPAFLHGSIGLQAKLR
jgi:hypothetical protein